MIKYIITATLLCALSVYAAAWISPVMCLGVLVGDVVALVGFIFVIAT